MSVIRAGSLGYTTNRPESNYLMVSVRFGRNNGNLEVWVERYNLEEAP